MTEKIAVIIQARFDSSRLPGKVMKEVGGRPMLAFLIERIKRSKFVDDVILATTIKTSDDGVYKLGTELGVKVVRGEEDDVLARYAKASKETKANILIRITGDCPLVDALLLDEAIKEFVDKKVDYLSNFDPPTYPDGLDFEIFKRELLMAANKSCTDAYQREHVTPWIRDNDSYSKYCKKNDENYSGLRWTVDEPEDLEVIRGIVDYFQGDSNFDWKEVIEQTDKFKHLYKKTHQYERNEGAKLGKGQKLWRRAKRIIPGGNMLLSKRAEMHLPGAWPAYFSRAKGCKIWDLDGRELIDMSIMGIGTNILGYGNDQIDEVVQETIISGNMSTLNCPEEVYLAEKLVELHPWSDMVRFARSGGEANAIAIRIARAATGKETVAICGYHGWHDWYLATNLQTEDGLQEHLLPGLKPQGVPAGLAGTVKPFGFNRFDELERIVADNDLAAVKMEVQRSYRPEEGFLKKVRELCTRKGIILIFDECTSGFRETLGGLHMKYGVYPDMAMFGKALGNGYAITSILGIESVMQAAQNTFISSTFWTERIGPTAALKTLEIMEKEKSWEVITATGNKVREAWKKLSEKYNIEIEHYGLPALAGFTFKSENSQKYKTYITQEMLKRGYLASTCLYASTAHEDRILNNYFNAIEEIFAKIGECENSERSIDDMLEVPVAHTGFARLN